MFADMKLNSYCPKRFKSFKLFPDDFLFSELGVNSWIPAALVSPAKTRRLYAKKLKSKDQEVQETFCQKKWRKGEKLKV